MPDSKSIPAADFTAAFPSDAIHQLRLMGGALLTQISLYGQLAQLEWCEERIRLHKILVVSLLGFSCLLATMFFVGLLAIIASWETDYRIPVVMALIFFYGLGAVVAWWRFQALSALGSQAFSATREGLSVDIASLKKKL